MQTNTTTMTPQKFERRKAELEEYYRVLSLLLEDKINAAAPAADIEEVKHVMEKIQSELDKLNVDAFKD